MHGTRESGIALGSLTLGPMYLKVWSMKPLYDSELEQLIWVYIRLRSLCASHDSACYLMQKRYPSMGFMSVWFSPSRRVIALVQREPRDKLGRQWERWRDNSVVCFIHNEEVVIYLERNEPSFWQDVEKQARLQEV